MALHSIRRRCNHAKDHTRRRHHARLSELITGIEICDADGKVIGSFRAKLDPAKCGPLQPQISEEELQRRLQIPGKRYTIDQVLERFRQRRPGPI